jgi:glycine cleavage system H protein
VCPGEVVEVNTNLNDDPALVNSSAEGDGWMTKVQP